MPISIIEKILGNNSILANNYIKDTIKLTKSIIIKNDYEANLYNKYIGITYPSHTIDLADKSTWRYYNHLSGIYHPVDKQITLVSLDNGGTITLNSDIFTIHLKTKEELLKFDLFYKELVDRYPEQELFIKSIITDKVFTSINSIISAENFTITNYNTGLIEDNEQDLLKELQDSIINYKQIRLIQYYNNSDTLFMASQYHILYNFLLLKILGIRLTHAKTLKAHTFYIKNYLSSHHYLDKYYSYLTKKQALYLYRNLLYLDNHAGMNNIFQALVDKLFTERNISIVSYRYNQINEVDNNNAINYTFNQKLLNTGNLVYFDTNYNLNDIKEKELNLTTGNNKELMFGLTAIDDRFKNSLFSTLITKDLESIIVDNTDTVRYKLIPTILDYWAYLLKTKRINYIVTIVDPVTNRELRLTTADLFKLFTVVLYKTNNIELTSFPDYLITRVFKETIPSVVDLLNYCYKKQIWFNSKLDSILSMIPSYKYIDTSNQCHDFIFSMYKLNIGLWVELCNISDKDARGQFELMFDKLTTNDIYNFGPETVDVFLNRIGIPNLFNYTKSSLDSLLYSIINNFFNNKLDFLNSYFFIQKSLVEVFRKFNSYSVQLIDNYYSSSPAITGPKDTLYSLIIDSEAGFGNYNSDKYTIYITYSILNKLNCEVFSTSGSHSCYYNETNNVYITPVLNVTKSGIDKIDVLFNKTIINDLGTYSWLMTQPSTSQLEFLAMSL